MKTTMKIIAAALLTGLLLAGCYVVTDTGVGSVGIDIPEPRAAGADSEQGVGRIFLLNGTSLVDISDATSAAEVLYKEVEVELDENEVSIGPVPSGPGYQIVVALGDPVPGADGTDVFVPEVYAWTPPWETFAVVAGQAVDVELEMTDTPFGYVAEVLGANLVDISFVDDSLYAAQTEADESVVYRMNIVSILDAETDSLVAPPTTLPDGELATGIGTGADVNLVGTEVPWINTNTGVIPYVAATNTLNTTFFSDYPGGETPRPAVLSSGAFVVAKDGFPGDFDLFGWFQVDGGIGGVYDEDDTAAPGAPKQWLTDIDLSTFIAGEPITDLVVTTDAGRVEAYFASKLGAFKLPQEVLSDATVDTVPEILDIATFFEVVVDGQEAVISQLDLVGTELYLGTNRGVVSVQIADLGDNVIVGDGLVTESLGRVVRDMEIGATYHAILTDNLLIVSGDGGLNYTVLPIYAGLVTNPSGLYLNETDGVVLISGETGMASLVIDFLVE